MPVVAKLNDLKELKSWRPWTKEDTSRLRELVLSRKTDKEIAEILARSEGAVQMRRSKIGMTKWRKKPVKSKVLTPILTGGGTKEYGLEALKHTQSVLKLLGYRLAITKLEQ